jgi:hypothetical protein
MSDMKTTDGYELEVGKNYVKENGESCYLVDYGFGKYLIQPYYEGTAMEAHLYPSGHTELTVDYIHEASEDLVVRLYKYAPTAILDKEYSGRLDKIKALALTMGELIGSEKKHEQNNRTLLREGNSLEDIKSKMLSEKEAVEKELGELQSKLDSKRLLLSELEDSIAMRDVVATEDNLKISKDAHMLECLYTAGVDNWGGYDYALEEFEKRYPDA